jgi:cephalosporin-C deacetylase-like acetyl esterase
VFLLVGLYLGGCVAHTTTPVSTDAATLQPAPADPAASVFDYQSVTIPFENAVLDEEETKNYLVRYIHFRSHGDNRQRNDQVTGRYYESKHPGKKPLVIVLPIFGGHVYPSQNMTLYLKRISAGDVHVFRMLGEQNLTDWWSLKHAPDEESFMELWQSTAQAERNTIFDIRRTIDWALARPEVDPDRIAVIGFSRGAIMAAVATANDRRLAASVLVMGGAHPHQALATCPMLRGEGVQSKVQKEFGWSLDEFADKLEPLYRDLDPANYAGRVTAERILIVEATKDNCIPAQAREDLWLAMGRPRRISIPHGHKRAFLSMTPLGTKWLQKEIWSFLEETL